MIAMSGAIYSRGGGDILSIAENFGADAALPKPFPPKDLIETVNKLLGEGEKGTDEGRFLDE